MHLSHPIPKHIFISIVLHSNMYGICTNTNNSKNSPIGPSQKFELNLHNPQA